MSDRKKDDKAGMQRVDIGKMKRCRGMEEQSVGEEKMAKVAVVRERTTPDLIKELKELKELNEEGRQLDSDLWERDLLAELAKRNKKGVFDGAAGKILKILLSTIPGLVWIGHSGRSSLISKPPGTTLYAIAEFFFSPKTVMGVFDPTLADWHHEYNEALQQKRQWKAQWINWRYRYVFLKTMGLHKILSFIKGWFSLIS